MSQRPSSQLVYSPQIRLDALVIEKDRHAARADKSGGTVPDRQVQSGEIQSQNRSRRRPALIVKLAERLFRLGAFSV